MKSYVEITVRYAETDQMHIAHHSNYPIWYECARTQLIKDMGISYSDLEKQGLILPLLELQSKYIKAALYEDVLIITARLVKYSISKATIAYEVYRKNTMELLNKGITVHGMVHKDLTPSNTKKEFPEFYSMLQKHCEPEK